jgi:hypothetical protein
MQAQLDGPAHASTRQYTPVHAGARLWTPTHASRTPPQAYGISRPPQAYSSKRRKTV